MRKMKMAALTVVAAAALSLAACGGNNDANNRNVNRVNPDGDVRSFGMTDNTRNHMNNWNGRIFDYDIRDNNGRNDMRRTGMHRNTRLEASDELAERIADMREVDRAIVFLTDNNAYVGVVLENDARTRNLAGATPLDGSDRDFGRGDMGDGVSIKLKDRIAKLVKSQRPGIRNVFVSANPGFLESLNDYMADLNAGRPVIGLIEEFNDMVERIFPTRFNDMGNARGMQNGSTAPFTNRAR